MIFLRRDAIISPRRNSSPSARRWIDLSIAIALTLLFAFALLRAVVHPDMLGRIGIDPSTGKRWHPTGFDLIAGYTTLAIASVSCGTVTLLILGRIWKATT
jgi:hypothetical protein